MSSAVTIRLPDWVEEFTGTDRIYGSDEDRMRLAIELARQNVAHGTGGPFGAAVFQQVSGKLVSVGVNLVVALNNSSLHAEVVAFMFAQQAVGSFTLSTPDRPAHELFTSCDPCAMCLGAVQWAGVKRVVAAADRDDAEEVAFDEGPVFDESYRYLERRGITIERGFLREEGRQILLDYRNNNGRIYNP